MANKYLKTLTVSIEGIELKIGDTLSRALDKLKSLSDTDQLYRLNSYFTSKTVEFPQGGSETEYRFYFNNLEFLRLIFAQGVNMSKKHVGYVSRLVSIELNASNWVLGRAQCISTNVRTFGDAMNVFKDYDTFYIKGGNESCRKYLDLRHNGECLLKNCGTSNLRYGIRNIVENGFNYSVNIESRNNYLGYVSEIAVYANKMLKSHDGEVIVYR